MYMTRGLTKQIHVDKLDLTVTWGNLELAFANLEELGVFTGALKYVTISEEGPSKGMHPSWSTSSSSKKEDGSAKPNPWRWRDLVPASLVVLAIASSISMYLRSRSRRN